MFISQAQSTSAGKELNMETNNNKRKREKEDDMDNTRIKRSKTKTQKLIDIPPSKRHELAKQIVANHNWRSIGLYFEEEYKFTMSEKALRSIHGDSLPPLQLCEHLIEELASRNVSIQSFINVLNNQNVGMNAIAVEIQESR